MKINFEDVTFSHDKHFYTLILSRKEGHSFRFFHSALNEKGILKYCEDNFGDFQYSVIYGINKPFNWPDEVTIKIEEI